LATWLVASPGGAHSIASSLHYSTSSGRSGEATLEGAIVSGKVYVFARPEHAVSEVRFWLDDPGMSGAPRQTEKYSPYDFAGSGSSGLANPFDTAKVPDGEHTITAEYRLSGGGSEVVSAGFTVKNSATQPTERTTVRINAGGVAQTISGTTWGACSSASNCSGYVSGGGYAYSENDTITGIPANMNNAIFQSEWTGGQFGGTPVAAGQSAFKFDFPVTNGSYNVRLHFAELNKHAVGARVFDVNVEGGTLELPSFDIYKEAGGIDKAIVREFPVTVGDGKVTVDFIRRVENAKVSAIEILPAGTTTPPPPAPEPATDLFAWETKAPSPIARYESNGAVVGGKVYVFGGFTGSNIQTTARSDLYDPATNTWKRIADMPVQLTHSPAVVVGEEVWLVGGFVGDHPGPSTADVWIYNTRTNAWRKGPSLPLRRGAGGAALVGREMHFFGGVDRAAGSNVFIDEEEHWALNLDNLSAGWRKEANLPVPRNHLAGAALGGKVYAIGGQFNENESTGNRAEVHRFDPATDAWTRVADLPAARGHTTSSAFVSEGRIVVAGGTLNGKKPAADVTAYDPKTNVWVKLPSLPAGRKTPVAGLVGNAIVSTTGSGGGATTTTWRGVLPGKWEKGASMPVSLGEVAAGIVGKKLYVVGEGSPVTLSYDLSTGAWGSSTALAQRPYVGHHHAAEVVGGKLYLVGGLGKGAGKVQIFDPASNSWKLGADMPFAAGSSSTAVIGGRIYAAGGIVGSSTTTRSAVYDPAANRWVELAPMKQGRNHAAASTDGKKLYVFGGRGPGNGDSNVVANGFDTVQVYDPATNAWASSLDAGSGLAPLPQARGGTGKAVFHSGEFYIMGGETKDGAGATASRVYDRVDVYDPVLNRWRRGTAMPTARHGIFPLPIAGRIVVVGGGTQAGFSSSNVLETYNPAPHSP